jgi:hypothetical protein
VYGAGEDGGRRQLGYCQCQHPCESTTTAGSGSGCRVWVGGGAELPGEAPRGCVHSHCRDIAAQRRWDELAAAAAACGFGWVVPDHQVVQPVITQRAVS